MSMYHGWMNQPRDNRGLRMAAVIEVNANLGTIFSQGNHFFAVSCWVSHEQFTFLTRPHRTNQAELWTIDNIRLFLGFWVNLFLAMNDFFLFWIFSSFERCFVYSQYVFFVLIDFSCVLTNICGMLSAA